MYKARNKMKLAVILPELYRGGTLRGAINIARMLLLGAKARGCELDLSFGHVDSPNTYQNSDFEELRLMGVKIRPFKREVVSAVKMQPILTKLGFSGEIDNGATYWSFNDGISNFEECDFWLIVSDRIQHPIPKHRPYAVVVYDYIQRYVPEIFGTNETSAANWKMFDAFASATRNAQFVICTTDQTKLDCINYAGIKFSKVFKFPMEFDPLEVNFIQGSKTEPRYLLWTTNSTQHKNHLNIIAGLESYFSSCPDSLLQIHMTGVYTDLFSSAGKDDRHYNDEYVVRVRKAIADSPRLKKRLHILGNLSDDEYLQKLISAYGVLHGAIYDNGTYSIVEAAWLGIPSISSDYPAIREACAIFDLNPVLFNPLVPSELTEALYKFEKEYALICMQLPNKEKLGARTFSVIAPQYWDAFVRAYESTAVR